MAISEDFKREFSAGNYSQALKIALAEIIELKITTYIVPSGATQAQSSDRLHTRINIVDGTIENEIGTRFLESGAYEELRELHLNQVRQGHDIIYRHLQILEQLFETLSGVGQPSSALAEPESKQAASWVAESPRSLEDSEDTVPEADHEGGSEFSPGAAGVSSGGGVAATLVESSSTNSSPEVPDAGAIAQVPIYAPPPLYVQPPKEEIIPSLLGDRANLDNPATPGTADAAVAEGDAIGFTASLPTDQPTDDSPWLPDLGDGVTSVDHDHYPVEDTQSSLDALGSAIADSFPVPPSEDEITPFPEEPDPFGEEPRLFGELDDPTTSDFPPISPEDEVADAPTEADLLPPFDALSDTPVSPSDEVIELDLSELLAIDDEPPTASSDLEASLDSLLEFEELPPSPSPNPDETAVSSAEISSLFADDLPSSVGSDDPIPDPFDADEPSLESEPVLTDNLFEEAFGESSELPDDAVDIFFDTETDPTLNDFNPFKDFSLDKLDADLAADIDLLFDSPASSDAETSEDADDPPADDPPPRFPPPPPPPSFR